MSCPKSIDLPCHPVYSEFEVVVDVDSKNYTITVIRLQEPQGSQSEIGMLGSSKNHKIVKIKKGFDEIKICNKIFKYQECLNDEEVVEKAEDALRTQTIDGNEIENLVNLDSKHFANYCKTGKLTI